jgi:tetratricopeptide (TPR) repeat protein
MSKKTTTSAEQNLQSVETALGKTEMFIEENQKNITIFILALIILVGGYWAYKKLYMEPRNEEAQKAAFIAQNYFSDNEFQLAVDGDGMAPGFLEIIDSYRNTKTGKLSKYYVGVSYLHLGQYEDAITFLSGFKTKNPELKAIATGAIGDAHLELGNQDKALKQYDLAIAVNNDITTPFYLLKKGLVLESMGNNGEALKAYLIIKEEYGNSAEARQIDKYITRVSL